MTTITQNGYTFIYRTKRPGQLPVVETWDIERVAAFIFLVEFHRLRSQRTKKGFTFVSAYGSIQYELEDCDRATYHDIDRLTKLLLPYTGDDLCTVFYTTFEKGLDLGERMLKSKVQEFEDENSSSFYTRLSKQEYEEQAAAQQQQVQACVPVSTGKTIQVWFQAYGIIPCVVVRETNSFYWVNGFSGGNQVVEGARVKKGTSRIITKKEEI